MFLHSLQDIAWQLLIKNMDFDIVFRIQAHRHVSIEMDSFLCGSCFYSKDHAVPCDYPDWCIIEEVVVLHPAMLLCWIHA